MSGTTPCCALVSTKNRLPELLSTSLPSIRSQIHPPDNTLIVNDGDEFNPAELDEISRTLSPLAHRVLKNARAPGAAGAWNHGLRHLLDAEFNGYVAILDDDDVWDPDHLSINLEVGFRDGTDVVVSGLRPLREGCLSPRPLITGLTQRDFYIGNPGWQGSNTFVHINAFRRIGGFREGMASTHDRDLALRLLRDPPTRIGFTGRWTATWHIHAKGTQLSSRRMPAKLSGLRWFWHFYGRDMTPEEADLFFSRSRELFGFARSEIVLQGPDLPVHRNMRGDLDAG